MADGASSLGRIVVVTGATGPLGSALARRFAELGDRIVLLGRSMERLAVIERELAGAPARHLSLEADLDRADDLVAMARSVRERLGPPAILLNAVGGYQGGNGLVETEAGEIGAMLAAHAVSTFNTLRAFLPDIREVDGGRIVTFSSPFAQAPSATAAAYAAAKAALEAITLSVARELASTNATANVITVRTIGSTRRSETRPEDIAETVVWLCSPAAATVNGAQIAMHGRT